MAATAPAIPIPTASDSSESRSKIEALAAEMKNTQQERKVRIFRRLDQMLEFKRPYEVQMERSYLLYDGISRMNPREPPVIEFADVVQPFAATFVETKTAEEYHATSDFSYLPLDDDDDTWKVELNMECVGHVRRKTYAQARKLDLIRTKNIAGVAIKRKGYRLIMRTLKQPIVEDEFGRILEYKEMELPYFDDIFEEEVDPFDFVVDPNAKTMNDAVDCGQFHRMNYEEAFELFGKDPRYDFEGVKAGLDNMVEFFEYFNAPRDEWGLYAWSSTGSRYALDHSRRPAKVKEVFFGGLPDNHKMLPFTSQHCGASFITGFFFEIIGRSPETGEETSHGENIVGHKVFWTPGVPVQISDLIDTRTSYGRQALEALKMAATNIVATKGSHRFNNKKKWKNGEQAIGMMGQFEIANGAQAHINDFEFHFGDIYEQMVQRIGVDPRNIADGKAKTATEDIGQRESAAKRLNAEIEYNEIVEGCRDGLITYKLIQQYYTKPEIVRLTGKETEEQLAKFDDTKGEHPVTGGPMIGKRYRRIRTSKPMSEFKTGNKNMLRGGQAGKYSFPARPEWIQTGDVDVMIVPTRRAGQIQALLKQAASDDVDLWLKAFPLTQPNPQTGASPVVSMDDMPNFRRLVEKWVLADGGNIARDIGNKDTKSNADKINELIKSQQQSRVPFNAVPKNQPPTSPVGVAAASGAPAGNAAPVSAPPAPAQ